jgi:chemotaxis protein CheD
MPGVTLASFLEPKMVVGVGELAVSNDAWVVLATYSLGSCVAVSIYDPVARVGGLLHAMLPDSGIDPAKGAAQPAMFIDTGLPALLEAAGQLGAEPHRLQICVAGGAQVLDGGGFFNIGKRNCAALAALLSRYGLRIQAEQIGGLNSRSLYLRLRSGEVRLKISGQTPEYVLCASLMPTLTR